MPNVRAVAHVPKLKRGKKSGTGPNYLPRSCNWARKAGRVRIICVAPVIVYGRVAVVEKKVDPLVSKRRSRGARGDAAQGHATDRALSTRIARREPPLAEGMVVPARPTTECPPRPLRPLRASGSTAVRGAPRLRRFHPNEPMRDGKQLPARLRRDGKQLRAREQIIGPCVGSPREPGRVTPGGCGAV